MSRFFFCKDECKKEEDILIETDQKSLQRGRYSIEYIEGSAFGLYVNITQVTKSDMGQYKCGYGRALSKDSSSITFTVIVIDGEFYPHVMFLNNSEICSSYLSMSVFHIYFILLIVHSSDHFQTSSNKSQLRKRHSFLIVIGFLWPHWPTSSCRLQFQTFMPVWPPPPSQLGFFICFSLFLKGILSHSLAEFRISPVLIQYLLFTALTSSKPNWTLVPLTSSAATTAGLRSVSGSYSPSSAFPETTNRPEAAGKLQEANQKKTFENINLNDYNTDDRRCSEFFHLCSPTYQYISLFIQNLILI